LKYSVHKYKNRMRKPVEVVLRKKAPREDKGQ
jgi:hypothetical protein